MGAGFAGGLALISTVLTVALVFFGIAAVAMAFSLASVAVPAAAMATWACLPSVRSF